MPSKIEWCDETYNPITGCSKISEGCQNCYAERMAKRFAGRFGYPKDKPFGVTFHKDKVEEPLKWKKPKRIFVCSMSDFFNIEVEFAWQLKIFRIIRLSPRHTFMFLTKRPNNMRDIISRIYKRMDCKGCLPNVWLGVTAENQQTADERIPILLQIPAAKRFVSVEPMLGAVDLQGYYLSKGANDYPFPYLEEKHRTKNIDLLDWVICGAETGPKKRPMKTEWARSLRDQCSEAGVPFFFKKDSNGSNLLDGRTWEESPK